MNWSRRKRMSGNNDRKRERNWKGKLNWNMGTKPLLNWTNSCRDYVKCRLIFNKQRVKNTNVTNI
jgi:hypothetical protein